MPAWLQSQVLLTDEMKKNMWQCKGEDPDPNEDVCDYWNDNRHVRCFWCGAPKPPPPSQGPYR